MLSRKGIGCQGEAKTSVIKGDIILNPSVARLLTPLCRVDRNRVLGGYHEITCEFKPCDPNRWFSSVRLTGPLQRL